MQAERLPGVQAEQVFAGLHASYATLIRSIAHRQSPCCAVIDAGDYEVAMLETLWRLARLHPAMAANDHYVRTALRRACTDLWRRWRVTARSERPVSWDGEATWLEPAVPGPEAGGATREALAVVRRLDPRLRRPLLLYALGWRQREIARLLRRTPHTVGVRIRKAQRQIREMTAKG